MTRTQDKVMLDKRAIARAAHMLGDTWALLIISELINGSRRFGEIQEALEKISSQTLTNRLKMLEKYGFVVREAFLEIPPRVEYHLTDKGIAVEAILRSLAEFGAEYMPEPETPLCTDVETEHDT